MPYIFKFYRNNKLFFFCPINCRQCNYVKPDRIQCKNRVCIGIPLCWMHAQVVYKLRVKDSRIHGKGVFAHDPKSKKDNLKIVFKKGQVILEYLGEILDQNELERRYSSGTAPYTLKVKDSVFVDAACERSISSIINHSTSKFANVEFSYRLDKSRRSVSNRSGRVMVIVAKKNIRNNQELLVNYGSDYVFDEPGTFHQTKYHRS